MDDDSTYCMTGQDRIDPWDHIPDSSHPGGDRSRWRRVLEQATEDMESGRRVLHLEDGARQATIAITVTRSQRRRSTAEAEGETWSAFPLPPEGP